MSDVVARGGWFVRSPRRVFRSVGLAVLTVMSAILITEASAEYPERPIRWITPYGAGSSSDLMLRILSPKLSEILGQQVIIENRAGGGGNIAAEQAAQAAPDGYTIFLGSSASHGASPHLQATLPYKPFESFAPVSGLFSYGFVMVVPADFPATTSDEFVEAAKAQSGSLKYASSGNGTSSHLIAAAYGNQTGLQMAHIPYNSGSQAYNELINGTVSLMFYPYNALEALVKAGQVKPIMVTGPEREPLLPDTPTAGESGLSDFVWTSWMAVYAPAGTPKDIIDKLYASIDDALKDEGVLEKLKTAGVSPNVLSPEELDAFGRAEYERYGKIIEELGLKNSR